MSAQIHTLKTGDLAKDKKTADAGKDYDALVNQVFNRLNVQLLQKVSEMLDNADDSLQLLAENAESNELKTKLVELARVVQRERGNIDKAFFISINDRISRESKSDEEELALIDQDEMDEMVMITTMYSNAMNNYGQEVNNLEARFEFLEMHAGKQLPKHAIDPKYICEAFQAALKQVNLTLDYKLLLFKLFDLEVSSRLGEMYKSLNQLFIDADVMPEVVYKAKNLDSDKEPPSKKPAPADNKKSAPADNKGFTVREARYYDPQKNKSTNFIPRSQEEIGYFISQFMNGFTTAKGEGIPDSFSTIPSDKDNYNCFSRNDLMSALSRLQSKVIKTKKAVAKIDAEKIKRAIVAEMGQNQGGAVTKRVHVLDQRSIDFVGMMFKEITLDTSISKVITNLLMLLQIPVIKAAMLDEQLFTSEEHPARNTLDLISQAGKGVTDEQDHVYIKLEKIVDSILQEYEVDVASFERAVDQLRELIRIEEEVAAENERIEQLEIIKGHARDVVLTEMRQLTTNKKLPKNVKPLILKHWPTMMCHRYVNHGKESHEWLVSLMLLKLLMRCLQPIRSKAQWQMLSTNHQPLVEAVNDELYESQQDPELIDAQVAALKQTFLKMLDDCGYKLVEEPAADTSETQETATPYVEDEPVEAANEEFDDEHNEEVAKIEEQARIAREKIARLPSDLHPGEWFEIFNGQDKPVRRLKLSVILTEVAKLIFVDCHGIKVIEKDAGDFASELKNNKSRLLADHKTFEHALGTVIHRLAA